MPRTPKSKGLSVLREAVEESAAAASAPAPVLSRDELRQIEIGAPPER